jgi:hypothetical protein|tara:strand:+ start:690 stop:1307 length:618 start_codon:yes stop_codon:yes gene_type:complete
VWTASDLKSKNARIAIFILVACIALAFIWYFLKPGALFIESTFDKGTEDWMVVGDTQSALPSYSPDGGHPGGFIYATDRAAGGVWYWRAPKRFYGDRSSYYGQHLSFELKQSSTDNQFDNNDIILTSAEEELRFNTTDNPGLQWTSYKVAFDQSEVWINKRTGQRATKAEIYNVLAQLDGLHIRGEFIVGDDIGSLDNVRLGLHP